MYYEGVSGPKKRQISTRKSRDSADFLEKIALTLEPPRINYHKTSRYPNKVISLILQARNSFLMMVVQPEGYFSR